ncbi:aspartic peptidase domain-containing protein [Cladorrhinum samala]|uniref:Aspartic peptidase domain-containing protein n=1 Tax=Cladorrhinum samala TaxID=585594 RepID=A0AAV9HKC8_9PEZI|nr:aspartic peptidase domain-containing protein [Cladorrhinum samala]
MAFVSTRSLLSALALCLSSTATSSANGHVLLPFTKLTDRDHAASAQLSPRAEGAVGVKLTSNTLAYVVKASIGTPPQPVSLLVNPSVGDTWVPDAAAYDCAGSSRYRYCDVYEDDPSLYDPSDWADNSPTCVEGYVVSSGSCKWGMYSKSNSSTYLPANTRYTRFSQMYGDDIFASGSNFTDKIAVGEIELDDYPMGLVDDANRYVGMLGLGRNSTSGGDYVNFIDRLVARGSIKSAAYSIWLDDAEGSSGNLLLGAIDKSRYDGDLIRFAARSSMAYSGTFGAVLTSVNGTMEKGGEAMPAIRSNDFPVGVTISPGEVFSYLPETIVDSIAAMVGAQHYSPATSKRISIMTIPCDAGSRDNSTANFVLQLAGEGGPVLNVKTSDLVLPLSLLPGTMSSTTKSKLAGQCAFGIQKWGSYKADNSYTPYYNLGSSLLRRSYLVFDVVNREVAVAPTKFGSQSASVIETFEKRGAVIPSSKSFGDAAICDYDDYSGSNCRNRSGPSSSGSYGTDPDLGPSHWRTVALGVGITFGVLILISVIATVVVCTRLRKGKKGNAKEVADEEAEASGDEHGVSASGAAAPPVQQVSQTAPQVPEVSVTPPPPAAQPRQMDVVPPTDEPQPQVAEPKTEQPVGKGKEVDRSA